MLIGGGQDLLARMKDYIDSPDRVVNVKGLDASVTATPGGGLRIGSAVKIVDLSENAQVTRLYPAIVHAAGEVGTPQIRHQGLSGNVTSAAVWVLPQRGVCLLHDGRIALPLAAARKVHAIFATGARATRTPVSLAVPRRYAQPPVVVRTANGRFPRRLLTLPTMRTVLKENLLETGIF